MRIGIQASNMLATHLTGIEYSLTELVRQFAKLDERNDYVLYFNFVRSEYAERFESRVRPLLSDRVRASICRVPNRVMNIARELHWPIDTSIGRCSAVYYHSFDMRPQWFGAKVLTIHDLMPMTHAEYYPKVDVEYFNRWVPKMVRKADALIAVSQHTKDVVVDLLGVPADRVFVARHGIDVRFRRPSAAGLDAVRERFGLRRPYLLSVSTAEPRKNLARLVDALALLRTQGHEDLQLVVAGKSAWGSPELRSRIEANGLSDHVKLLGYVDEADLPSLYAGAEVFSLPSIAEGFGLPALEAMACGTPVVASNTTALPEVCGDAAILVDPLNTEALADAVSRLRTDSQLRAALIERGFRRAATFSWESTARATVAVLERVGR